MLDTRLSVARYLSEGWAVIPIPKGSKAPTIKDWINRTFALEDFEDDSNIGVRLGTPSGNLVDVDLDCPEAVSAAASLLPATERAHGRPSTGISHYWYISEGKSEKWLDLDGEVLVELRSTGGQTVLPPSQHPSGELLFWQRDGTPAHVGFDVLRLSARDVATAALLGRHWPKGSRHEAAQHAAGFLAARHVDARRVESIIGAAALAAHDEEVDDRRRVARDTSSTFESGGKTSGGPSLAELLGAEIVKRLTKWWGANADDKPRIGPYSLTESGDADLFAHYGADSLRFDHRRGIWLLCDKDSNIWQPDAISQSTELMKKLMRFQQSEAIKLTDPGDSKRAFLWYKSGENRNRLTNGLKLAQSVPPLANAGDDWDLDAFLLGCPNGVVDLRTGELRKALPEEHVSMRVRVPYDPTAECPLWTQTLADIFAPGPEFDAEESAAIISFMQRAIGYSVTGDCREECCFIMWGGGGNGKGTFINTIAWLLADYRDDMPYSTLEKAQHGRGIPNDVAKLFGRRFITCSEINEFRLDESRLKALTGRDPMTARFLHKEFFTFIPVGKIWIATNNKPQIVGQDDGIWRRIRLIPFLRSFTAHPNQKLKDDLIANELPGILRWIVEGAKLWLDRGLDPPKTVQAATEAYRHESNPITPFVEACCVVGPDFRVQAGQVFKAYEAWDSSPDKLTDKKFHQAMKVRFGDTKIVRKHGETPKTFYRGVGLQSRDAELSPENAKDSSSELPF